MKDHIPKSVAVLPFVDLSGSREGFDVVRRGFFNHFSSLPFKEMKLSGSITHREKQGLSILPR